MTAYLTGIEMKLLAREPLVLFLSLLFPILLMLLLAGAFSSHDASTFAGFGGTVFYVTSYLGAAIAAMGFMGTPLQLAKYRESGVLRRFRAAGLPSHALVVSQAAVLACLAVVAAAAMMVLAYAIFDLAAPESIGGVVAAYVVGILAFAGIGALLGAIMPSARAAQGLGVLLFFGTFVMAGGGPPPNVLPQALTDIMAWTPTGLLITAIRTPWTSGGMDGPALVTLAIIAVAGFVLAMRQLSRS